MVVGMDRAISERVVARYLQAGVFQAPPALLDAVSPWVEQVYAGHVLAADFSGLEAKLNALEASIKGFDIKC